MVNEKSFQPPVEPTNIESIEDKKEELTESKEDLKEDIIPEKEADPQEEKKDKGTEEDGKEKLSSVLQEVKDMSLNFDDEEYDRAARDSRYDSREVSEDNFLGRVRASINNPDSIMPLNQIGNMLRVLNRKSMRGHPKMELFRQAVQKLKEISEERFKKETKEIG